MSEVVSDLYVAAMCLSLVLSGIVFWKDTYPTLVEAHRWYQRNRLEDGWTLPWFLCWLWWFGLERAAPRFLRTHHAKEPTLW